MDKLELSKEEEAGWIVSPTIAIDVIDIDRTIEGLDFRKMRLNSGKSLREVEYATDISNPYLSQLENKKIKNPSFRVVMTLLKYYGIRYA